MNQSSPAHVNLQIKKLKLKVSNITISKMHVKHQERVFPDNLSGLIPNSGQPSPWNPAEDAVNELAYHGLSESVGFLGEDLESKISLEAKTLYYKRLFDW